MATAWTPRPASTIELRQVSGAHELQGVTVNGYQHPAWSSGGQTLVAVALTWTGVEPDQFLVGFNLNGDLQPWPGRVGGWEARHPSFDPTQSRVAIDCWINLTCRGLLVMETAVDAPWAPQCLLSAPARNPAWSPDGQSIIVETDAGLRAVSPSGGAPQPVTMRADDETPAWSPDATQVVFSSTLGGTRDLWIKDMMSGTLHRLTYDAAVDNWPAWSPDGRTIAFASDRSGSSAIWAIHVAGGTPVPIADAASVAGAIAPVWSPDGRTIAFQSDYQIWVATDLPADILAVEPLSWSRVKTLYRDTVR